MTKAAIWGLIFFPLWAGAQSIKSTNFKYWYDMENPVDIKFNLVRKNSGMEIQYNLYARNNNASTYQLTWEKRKSYGEERGNAITPKDSVLQSTPSLRRGLFMIPVEDHPYLLVCRVADPSSSFSWIYYRIIEKNFPVNGYVVKKKNRLDTKFALEGDTVKVAPPQFPVICTYYKQAGSPALPPYTTDAATADNFRKYDSTFTLNEGDFQFKKQGLYLFQNDTTVAEGFSICVVPKEFPRYGKIDGLSQPVVYLTTPEEFTTLQKLDNDKAAFDRLILSITADKNRAKTFMRSYYRRVAAANILFTTYKEGWKTDQGFIYLIFGVPDDVHITSAGEVWNYNSPKAKFVFSKSGSVYDPNYMSLVRSPQLKESWFSMIDMWRKSRF